MQETEESELWRIIRSIHERAERNVAADPTLTYEEEHDRLLAEFAKENQTLGREVQNLYWNVRAFFIKADQRYGKDA